MNSHRGLRLVLMFSLLTLAGCAEKTTTTQAPTPSTPPPTVAATPPERPAPPSTPSSSPDLLTPPPPPASALPATPQDFVEEAALKDVLFESGRTEIGPQGAVIMKNNAGWLIEHAGDLVLIEGHTDYKGAPDANMAVGERRARAAMEYLVKAGVTQTRIQIVSYGSDRPVCPQRTEACAAKNRRVHFLVKPQ